MPNRAVFISHDRAVCPRSVAPPVIVDGFKPRHTHLQLEGALTTGKPTLQDSLPTTDFLLAHFERRRRFRGLALLLEFSPQIDAHREEFEEILLLPR